MRTGGILTFPEFYTKRREELKLMVKQANRAGITFVRKELLKYCNAHPTELNPAPVKANTIKEFMDLRGNLGYRKVNDLMQQFYNMIQAHKRKKHQKSRDKWEKKIGRFFHLDEIPKKVVMTDEQKKLFPQGSPIDRSRYK